MALFRCGVGGALNETELWSNANPAATFAAQDVTLSDSISNYKYIKFEFRKTNSDSDTSSIIVDVNDLLTSTFTGNTLHASFCYYSGTIVYCRYINYLTATSVHIDNSVQIGANSNNNNSVIPTKIYGMK